MARVAERAAIAALRALCGPSEATPAWLSRPDRASCKNRWALVERVYGELTGARLPQTPPPRERRAVDGVFRWRAIPFLFELDERQHFNRYRAATLRLYPRVPVAFDRERWLRACEAKATLETGGFARPCPPLFPGAGGRHRQRAFRDAVADLLPDVYGWLPTLRLLELDVKQWMHDGTVEAHIAAELDRWYVGGQAR
jgi:hypothetical protein